ncbi:hypothetical protein FOZ76_08555 [Verticiella sediminum]|uniref:Uncharacterized protein n=1 Tax=Verticiella sediminum TaxID=1247510 RepID=A0A556AUK8_9BURK|nr:hypothetical protein [Verticiella sediminum]TSH96621.1 hypothetical protein FOZ76_08555 [Verticiella sediminum]
MRLPPGQTLSGIGPQSSIRFAAGQDGLQLAADNQVKNLTLATDPERRPIFNDPGVAHWGRLTLRGLAGAGGGFDTI